MFEAQYSSLTPLLINEVPLVEPGKYEVINGDNKTMDFNPDRLSFDIPEADGPFPGVKYLANYTEQDEHGADVVLPVVSFLYNKRNTVTGEMETELRVIILRGIGYGIHHDHKFQDPAFYLVGAEIGKFDPKSGKMTKEETESTTIKPKNYSLACVIKGPYDPVVLANP